MKEMAMSVTVRLVVIAFSLVLAVVPARAQTVSPALQGFGIVLVLGDVQDGGTSDSVPPAARAALADLKDFLPYRSYRVLDTAWLLASSATRQAVSSRLQGPDEQDYEVTLDRLPVGPSSLQVHFSMREPDGNAERRAAIADREAALKSELQQLTAAHAALQTQLKRAEAAQNRADVDALRHRLADMEVAIETRQRQARYAPGGATLIDTSFTMSLGETVVVGTSRMRGGNRALIVLLTAATRGAKPRE
jgi:hypothetical protein